MKVTVEHNLKWEPYKSQSPQATQWYLHDPLLTQQTRVTQTHKGWEGFLLFRRPNGSLFGKVVKQTGFATKEEAFAWCETEWLKEWSKQ